MAGFLIGDRVTYIPGHARDHDGITHPDCERGTVSSVRADIVFVRFDDAVVRIGWENTTAQACTPDDLINHGGPAAPELLAALEAILNRYVTLAESGDAGFWDCEKEDAVRQSRAAIAKARGEQP